VQNLIYIFIFTFGICIGSFLNVCIYRMPRDKSIFKGRSHCPSCDKKIAWYDNIPLISIIALRGKCRNCAAGISKRYFLVELLTGVLFLALYRSFAFTPHFFIYAVMVSGLIGASFIDLDYQLIPDSVSLGGLAFGLIASFVYPELHGADTHIKGMASSFIGALSGGASIYLTGLAGNIIFKKKLERLAGEGITESMGGGDVKLMAMIGSILGWKLVILAFFLAPFFGAVAGVVSKIKFKAQIIPYGPYLAIASMISVFWGEAILKRIFYF